MDGEVKGELTNKRKTRGRSERPFLQRQETRQTESDIDDSEQKRAVDTGFERPFHLQMSHYRERGDKDCDSCWSVNYR